MKVLGSVSIFCRWMTDCDIIESVLYPSEKLILFLPYSLVFEDA
jgi:hypothetical protein